MNPGERTTAQSAGGSWAFWSVVCGEGGILVWRFPLVVTRGRVSDLKAVKIKIVGSISSRMFSRHEEVIAT